MVNITNPDFPENPVPTESDSDPVNGGSATAGFENDPNPSNADLVRRVTNLEALLYESIRAIEKSNAETVANISKTVNQVNENLHNRLCKLENPNG